MEEDFSLSVKGADIQNKMPIPSPTSLGISKLSKILIQEKFQTKHSEEDILKIDQIQCWSQSLSENLIIKRSDLPITLRNLSNHEEMNSNTPKASLNVIAEHYSLDKELKEELESKPGTFCENNIKNSNCSQISKVHCSSEKRQSPRTVQEEMNLTSKPRYASGSINVLQRFKIINNAFRSLRKRTRYRKMNGFTTNHSRILNDSANFCHQKPPSYNISFFLDENLMPLKAIHRLTKSFERRCGLLGAEMYFFLKNSLNLFRNFTFRKYYVLLVLQTLKIMIISYLFYEFSLEISMNVEFRGKHWSFTKLFIIFILLFELLASPEEESIPFEMPKRKNRLRNAFRMMGFSSVFLYFVLPFSIISKYFNILLLLYYEDFVKITEFWMIALKTTESLAKIIDILVVLLKFLLLLHTLTLIAMITGFFKENQRFSNLMQTGQIVEAYFLSMVTICRLIFEAPYTASLENFNVILHFILLFIWMCLFLGILMNFVWSYFGLGTSVELKELNKYLNLNKIDFGTKTKLRKYLINLPKKKALENLSPSYDILNSLERTFKNEIMLSSKTMWVMNYSRLFLRFSEKTNKRLVKKLKYRLLKPGELAFRQGDFNPSLILIISGCIDLTFNNKRNNKPIITFETVESQECLSELELITGAPKRFSAKSRGFSSVLELSRDDFLQVLRRDPADYETFCMIRDQIAFYSDFSALSHRCKACPETSLHNIEVCPIIHYIPNTEFLIQRHIFNSYQERKEFKRPGKKKRNSLFNLSQNRFFAMQIADDQKGVKSEEDNELALQEQSSILYPSDYSVESAEDDFSEEEFQKKVKSTNTLPSIKRTDKIDSLEVIDEESKSRSGTVMGVNKSTLEIGYGTANQDENRFTTKLLETKAFDTKRNISATEIKPDSKVMSEGGKLFEDYLKRNSLLSKQSSIGKVNNTSLSEFMMKGNPHYKNSNAVLSLTENKSPVTPQSAMKGRRNSMMMAQTSHTNTGTKSNKSSKATSKNTNVFDMFMDFDNMAVFEAYFPENNAQNILEKIKAKQRGKEIRSILGMKSKKRTDTKLEEDRSFRFVDTIGSGSQKKSHFVAFKRKAGRKTSIEKKSIK